jgi:hypothetical protein
MTHSQSNRAWFQCIRRASLAPTEKALKIVTKCAARIGEQVSASEVRKLVREAHKIDWRRRFPGS